MLRSYEKFVFLAFARAGEHQDWLRERLPPGAVIRSSGVPMPTNPEQLTESPSCNSATASSAVTILPLTKALRPRTRPLAVSPCPRAGRSHG